MMMTDTGPALVRVDAILGRVTEDGIHADQRRAGVCDHHGGFPG